MLAGKMAGGNMVNSRVGCAEKLWTGLISNTFYKFDDHLLQKKLKKRNCGSK